MRAGRSLSLLVCMLLAAVAAGQDGDSVYEGRPLNQWLADFRDPNILVRVRAAGVIGRHHRARAAEAVRVLTPFLRDGNEDIAARTITALGELGPAAQVTIPDLIQLLKDETPEVSRQAAAEALGKLGPATPQVVPALTTALKDGSAKVRGTAAEALGRIGPQARTGVASLIDVLRNDSGDVSAAAALALGRIGPADPQVVPALIAALKHPNWKTEDAAGWKTADAAAEALGEIGPAAAETAVPALDELVRAQTNGFASVPLKALGRMGPAAKAALPTLLAAADSPNSFTRQAAVEALAAVGQARPEVLAALRKALGDSTREVGETAGKALFRLGTDAVPTLLDALADPNASDRAAAALVEIGQPASPALLQALEKDDAARRPRLVETLARLCVQSKEPGPLVTALKNPSPAVRQEIASSLGRLGGSASAAVPALLPLLTDRDEAVRLAVALAVHHIDPARDRDAADFWAGVLTRRDHPQRLTALELLAPHVADVPQALPALAAVVSDREPDLRQRATAILAQLDAKGLARLCELATHPDRDVRRGVVTVLGQRQDPAAVPALVTALSDRDPEVLTLAAEALHKIDPGQSRGHAGLTVRIWTALLNVPGGQRYRAAQVLGEIGPAAQPAAEALVSLLEDDELGMRLAAAEALQQVAPTKAARTISVWAAALTSPDWQLQQKAATVFSQLGPATPEAVPALGTLLGDENPTVRQQALTALSRMGPQAKPAVAELVKVAENDADFNLREQAKQFLEQLDPDARAQVRENLPMNGAPAAINSTATTSFGAFFWRWLPALAGVGALLGLVGTWSLVRLERRRRRAARWEFLHKFTRLLKDGPPDIVFRFLERRPRATPQQQRDVLLADQAYRWYCGTPRPVQEYLERCPAVAARSSLVLDLLVGDCEGARLADREPDLDALAAQFPRLERRLRRRLAHLERKRKPLSRLSPTEQVTGPELPSSLGPSGSETLPSLADLPSAILLPENDAASAPATVTLAHGSPDPSPATVDHVPHVPHAAGRPVEALTHSFQPSVTGTYHPASAFLRPEAPRPAEQFQRIGRYAVEKLLGEGAFGTVYLARDEDLRRPVAIKVPKRSRVATEQDVEAYLAEARVLGSLDHPGIVAVYDFGRTPDGLCYVVSKYVAGTDLAARLKLGPLSYVEAATIVLSVAEALDHAHQKRLVHRDVKPANLLLDPQGTAFVTDFGLALTLEDIEQVGQLAGTPMYMSPEQARGEALDGRSDLFSLGVVFYELLTGTRPFHGRDLREVIEQIQRTQPPHPHSVKPRVPRELSGVCMRCLAKNPDGRYPNGQELALALRRWLKSQAAAVMDPRVRHLVAGRLLPYEARDAGLYLELLAGARGNYELPAILRFWKDWGEAAVARPTRRVGLLVGARGGGKTSFVRAGLLPRLDGPEVVFCEATPDGTEEHLLEALRSRFPALLAQLSLVKSLRWLARRQTGGGKVLVVIDQFERWLLAHGPDPAAELAQALALCDGVRLQVLLVASDDFLATARQWLGALNIPLEEGQNLYAQEPFDIVHARQVLTYLGQALRCLPDDLAGLSVDQRLFLDRAGAELAPQGKTLPVRVAGLVLAFREARWVASIYSQMGGVEGTILALLEERFGDGEAAPRRHAARRLVDALLPEPETPARSRVRTRQKLLKASGLEANELAFDEILAVLDGELKLITPVPGEATAPAKGDWRYRITDEQALAACRQWLEQQPGAKTADRFKRRNQQTAWENPATEAKRAAALRVWERQTLRDPDAERRPTRSSTVALLGLVLALFVGVFFTPLGTHFWEAWQRGGLLSLASQLDFWALLGGTVVLLAAVARYGFSSGRSERSGTADPVQAALKDVLLMKDICPSCQTAFPPATVVCLHCGYDSRAGESSLAVRVTDLEDEEEISWGDRWVLFRWWAGLILLIVGWAILGTGVFVAPMYQGQEFMGGVIVAGVLLLLTGVVLRR